LNRFHRREQISWWELEIERYFAQLIATYL
jgi:hypothetical protein